MAERGGGMIVNIAGIGAIVKSPAAICIAAGNAAIIVMSQTLGSASHRDNIRVVAVNPGPVATERIKAAASVQGNQKFNAAALLPWARPASVEEVGATVTFLASPLSSYTSGSVVTVDGGCPRPPRASNAFSLRSMPAMALVPHPDPATLSGGARRILAMAPQSIARMLAGSGPLSSR
jgi:Enoyl-(Acyl carrier protein) reductase